MKFDWDVRKNRANISKHGIDFRDAIYVFSDPFALNLPDTEHSINEERWLLLGKNLREQTLLVVHAFPNKSVTRIISARKATTTENKAYLKRLKK